MQGIVTLALLMSLAAAPGGSQTGDELAEQAPTASDVPAQFEGSASARRFAALRAYLSRELPRSARFIDHGVLALRSAGGTPHRYRLELSVGLFDHLSVGVTAHWLPGQPAPRVWPVLAVAVWRWQGRSVGVNLGAHYRPVLFPPVDRELAFVPETHFGVVSAELSAVGWFSAGLDLGVAHSRLPMVDPADTLRYRRRALFGGGAFARFGNRRVGLTLDALAALGPDPLLVFEAALDLRFGAFEERPRGGWREP